MSFWPLPTQTTERTPLRRAAHTPLTGQWLILARMLWIAIFVLTLVIFCANLLVGNYGLARTIMLVAVTSVWFTVSLVLFWRKSTDRVILPFSLMLVLSGGVSFPPPPLALATYGVWWIPIDFLYVLATVMLIFVYTFPDGRFVPGFTRWLSVGWIAVSILPILVFGAAYLRNWLSPLYTLVRTAFYCILILALLYRYRRMSTRLERQQIKWVIFAGAIAIGSLNVENLTLNVLPSYFPALGVSTQLHQLISALAVNFISVLIPLSIGIALLRYRLWDIDIIINRTLVYAILTASVIGLYILVVVSLGTLFQAQGNLVISLFATGIIAVLFQPLRERLQRAVNRLMYGERDDPYRVISRLGERLEATVAPDSVLPTIVETVAQALKLPYAAILLQQDEEFAIAASYGNQKGEPLALPLVYQRETIGKLLLAPRARGEGFTPADLCLLNELVRQVSVAAHAVQLTADLQQSNEHLRAARARLVTTREEERRRLRRDLHDGLGPALAALTLKIGAARKLLLRDPAKVGSLLLELNSDIETAIGDIRRLVYNLRPPALDDLGLVGAIRECAAQYAISREADQANDLHIEVEAPEQLPPLPAAVEVAAYRIVQEALTNVVRHARAHSCHILLSLDEMLTVEICDDGVGIAAEQPAGVGIQSMHERATELGGICRIEPRASGGTRVLARLPLVKE